MRNTDSHLRRNMPDLLSGRLAPDKIDLMDFAQMLLPSVPGYCNIQVTKQYRIRRFLLFLQVLSLPGLLHLREIPFHLEMVFQSEDFPLVHTPGQ